MSKTDKLEYETAVALVNASLFPTAILSDSGEALIANSDCESTFLNLIVSNRGPIERCLSFGSASYSDSKHLYSCRLKRIALSTTNETLILVSYIGIKDLGLSAQVWSADFLHQKKLLELSEMAAGVAHEINNPLSVIVAKIHLLRRLISSGNIDLEQLSVNIDKIEAHSTRIFKIVKSMRTFSRDARSDDLNDQPVQSIIDASIDLLNGRICENGIRIEHIGNQQNLHVAGRETELMQVFSNIVQNAIDALKSTPFPKITIEQRELDSEVEIAISDNGPGIDEETEAKIFLPFFTTKPPGSGTGIGLSISLRIISDHGGSIFLDRQRGRSCFVIRLPKANNSTRVTA